MMKKIYIFLTMSLCFVSATAQQPFRYDTIRTENGKRPTSGTSLFRYDTIQSVKPNAVQPKKTGTRTSSGNSASTGTSENKSSFDKRKLFLGGSFGLQFGDYTVVDISPQIGYAFSRYASAGLGISYTYMSAEYQSYKSTRNYAGMNLFGRFYPIPNIVLSVQPEINKFWGSDKDHYGQRSDSQVVPSFLVGGGLRIPAGAVGGILMMIQYDLIQDAYSPYGNNFFYSVGYTFGF